MVIKNCINLSRLKIKINVQFNYEKKINMGNILEKLSNLKELFLKIGRYNDFGVIES